MYKIFDSSFFILHSSLLSILIPIYNCDILPLLTLLYRAAMAENIVFEIICIDDASPQRECLSALRQSPLATADNIRLIFLPQNIGRARIRNLLAQEAKFDFCWFLDADMLPFSETESGREAAAKVLLHNYLELIGSLSIAPNREYVICGGHSYREEPPKDSALCLHWWYGSRREVRAVDLRAAEPYKSFTTSNFVASRSIFAHTTFDANISQYGHEDTLFGAALARRGTPFLHIANPMEHCGLERAEVFLRKTRQAVENLYKLNARISLDDMPIRLWQTYRRLARWRMLWLMRFLFWLLAGFWLRHLCSRPRPNLRYLDLYKLGYLCRLPHHIN
jgi:glycosyltransferase involved in cell wall biosynthesis